jgi:lipopolysaccharide export system permease protein
MLSRFDRYLLKNLALATCFIAIVLTVVVFLTQSLRFLELIMESGASSLSFWILTALAMPRFFEIIIPLAMMAATIFVYNKMTIDSELIIMRSIGYSPFQIARSALLLASILTVFLYVVSFYISPQSLSGMQRLSQDIKAQISTLLLREGVFNSIGSGLTVYIRDRTADGDLGGLMIHDSRNKDKPPSTILAKRGVILSTESGNQVIVYDGARHEYDRKKNILQRLNFERYTIELPDSNPVGMRWREPDERTITELFQPDLDNERDVESADDFRAEIHKRFTAPLLTIVFTVIATLSLQLGMQNRQGQGIRILGVILGALVIQGLYLTAFSLARQNILGVIMMYVLTLGPLLLFLYLLSAPSEAFRKKMMDFILKREKAV